MCVLLLELKTDSFTLITNRDEYLDRPSAPLQHWEDEPILAGRDLRAGGTWLGLSSFGRWGILTNFAGGPPQTGPSRGSLIRDWLVEGRTPERHGYRNFNAILGKHAEALYFSDAEPAARRLQPGLHTLANGRLDEPDPRSRALLEHRALPPFEALARVRLDLPTYGTRAASLLRCDARGWRFCERVGAETRSYFFSTGGEESPIDRRIW